MNSDGFGQPCVGYDYSLTKILIRYWDEKREMFKGGQLNQHPVCRQASQMQCFGASWGDLVWNSYLVHSNATRENHLTNLNRNSREGEDGRRANLWDYQVKTVTIFPNTMLFFFTVGLRKDGQGQRVPFYYYNNTTSSPNQCFNISKFKRKYTNRIIFITT